MKYINDMANQYIQVEELIFPTPWGYIAAKSWGNRLSMPVLAIHGYTDNAATFDHLIPLLPKGFYYLGLDLPGHGRSSFLPPGINLDFYTCLREIRRVLIQLNWTKCILLSHSAGGHFCLFLASLYPEIITKVVVIDLFPFILINKDTDVPERLHFVIERSFVLEKNNKKTKHNDRDDEKILQSFVRKHFSPISKQSACTLLKRVISEDNQEGTYTINSDKRKELLLVPLMTLDFHLSVIKKIKSPVLFITTSESIRTFSKQVPTINISINAIKNTLGPYVTVKTVTGSHNVHLDHPERVAPHVTKFITANVCQL